MNDREDIRLDRAAPSDLETVLPLVAAYHAFEGIASSPDERRAAVSALLDDPSLGEIWLMGYGDGPIGYVAVCFGFSIEFGGRDAFLDEVFVVEDARGRGVPSWALGQVAGLLADAGIRALHLEVARDNTAAKAFYAKLGFEDRSKYRLMSLSLGGDDEAG